MPYRLALCAFACSVSWLPAQVGADAYVKKDTRAETIRATLALHHLHDLSGDWYVVGPFDNVKRQGFDTLYPPEKKVDLKATYKGKDGEEVAWKKWNAALCKVVDLSKLHPKADKDCAFYFYHECEVDSWETHKLQFYSDESLTVWTNGERVLHSDHRKPALGTHQCEWKLTEKKRNSLLIKVCQTGGKFEMSIAPEISVNIPEVVRKRVDRDFPIDKIANKATENAEDEKKYYRAITIEPPPDCVLEVGGLAMRSDGKLYACTRRGEIWLIDNPTSEAKHIFKRFATGLHEPLGMHLEDDNTLTVIQRPELSRIIDRDGDGKADEFITLCDNWGVSGGYHEYAFGPAKDKNGNYFITLNVGFSQGGQSPVPWRGWCVKVDSKGKMEPWAYGLRSPNGVNFSPDGELFYADNQGEWVATNKLNHIRKGQFYGHQASLQWLKDSEFSKNPNKVRSGMNYDGGAGPTGVSGFPAVDPPVIWFPYGRMGQSASEMRWDTTEGKFGPFAGQCFVGDQTRSCVMRVAMEKVNGVYQGACFPFRSGLQCGVNRLLFGPDGSLYVGQTARGWGSVGGKPYGLQRIVFNGEMPFEIKTMTVTKDGFDLTFTEPVNPSSVTPEAFSLKSYTYIYHSTYGCPETDVRGEDITALKVSKDGLTVSLTVPERAKGRVYDLRAAEVRNAKGQPLLHAEAYYTLNEIPR